MGDLNYERKECTQAQISAHAVGSDGYHDHDLAYVRPGMQHGNAGILTKNTHRKCCKQNAAGIMIDFHATTIGQCI